MDTSTEYIKMCGKATEIQKSWQVQEGDLYSNSGGFVHIMQKNWHNRMATWLPHQGQLQAILHEKYIPIVYQIQEIWKFIDNFPSYLGYQLEPMSMEQLWLAFVMKKKYDKQWTGNEWEVINELS